ncbi:hypothetical protein B0H63DRAFT_498222 [Podospora didyma]|uniref:Uncharacterized protein n=1 Tax=Podospora didyma TaxID=330526 RepID=A0AAE0JXV5_9PEZI|nr:hypothetical protein B0H63DRAFT_498222 [Podospora didyma]
MVPINFESEPSYVPLALAALRVATVIYLSSTVVRSLYRAHRSLGPAQETRHRIEQRSKLTTTFGTLALLGFVFALQSALSYATLSYTVWAAERGITVPTLSDMFSSSADKPGLYLKYWLSETPVHLDALEIVAEKARRLYWGQQLDLATVSWTTLLAIEGRRRKIPFLWAYALLSQLINLSFAQNLFYVAMLLTPSPLSAKESRVERFLEKMFPSKPANWWPKPSLFYVPSALNYTTIYWLPYAAGTTSFPTAVALTKILSLAPLILPAVVPESWGTVYPDSHDAYRTFSRVFQFMSTASFLLHAKSTAVGLWSSTPEQYKHRHSIRIPFDTEKRSKWERSSTAIEKVLGSVRDHPTVAAAGKDVLLCALSLGLWAAVRAMDVQAMLQMLQILSVTSRRRSRPAKANGSSITSFEDGSDKLNQEEDLETKPGKTYEPTPEVKATINLAQSDVVLDDDFEWESGSLAWGLTALGGLAAGCSAVFGAECISR